MTIRAMWILLATVITAIARPSLAQHNWADIDRAVATARFNEADRTSIYESPLASKLRISGDHADASLTLWSGIAGVTLDAHGQITRGYVELRDRLLGWDYVNDPIWLTRVSCEELEYHTRLDTPPAAIHNLSLFTCIDYQALPNRYSSALGLHAFEDLRGAFGSTEPDPRMEEVYEEEITSCNELRDHGCEEARSQPVSEGWGVSIRRSGRAETFVRVDRDGTAYITHVIWDARH